jgi:CBS domain containing-hemolysin-like protein
MFAAQLTSQIIPVLHLQDTISYALQLMQENRVTQLPVVNNDKFLGIIDEHILLDAEDNTQTIATLHNELLKIAVSEHTHLYNVLKIAAEHSANMVAVINEEGDFMGMIPASALLQAVTEIMAVKVPGAIIVLEIEPNQYSPGEINRLVETNDAMIMQMNTSIDRFNGKMIVLLKLNKPEVSDIVATFQRYEYSVSFYQGAEEYENELRNNYENLLNYLSI